MKADLPIKKRVSEGCLFGLKRVLCEWGFNRPIVRINTDMLDLKVGGEEVVAVKVAEGKLQCNWAGEWKNWKELHESSELKFILDKAAETLKKAGGGSKGTTKGH